MKNLILSLLLISGLTFSQDYETFVAKQINAQLDNITAEFFIAYSKTSQYLDLNLTRAQQFHLLDESINKAIDVHIAKNPSWILDCTIGGTPDITIRNPLNIVFTSIADPRADQFPKLYARTKEIFLNYLRGISENATFTQVFNDKIVIKVNEKLKSELLDIKGKDLELVEDFFNNIHNTQSGPSYAFREVVTNNSKFQTNIRNVLEVSHMSPNAGSWLKQTGEGILDRIYKIAKALF